MLGNPLTNLSGQPADLVDRVLVDVEEPGMDELMADKLDPPVPDGIRVQVDNPVVFDAEPVIGFAPRWALEFDLPRLAVDGDSFGPDPAHPVNVRSYYRQANGGSSDGPPHRRVPGHDRLHVLAEDSVKLVENLRVYAAKLVVPGLVGVVHEELLAGGFVHEEGDAGADAPFRDEGIVCRCGG